jgi:hypothetical protein
VERLRFSAATAIGAPSLGESLPGYILDAQVNENKSQTQPPIRLDVGLPLWIRNVVRLTLVGDGGVQRME